MNLTSQSAAFKVISLSEVVDLTFIQATLNPVLITHKEDGVFAAKHFTNLYLSPKCQTGAKPSGPPGGLCWRSSSIVIAQWWLSNSELCVAVTRPCNSKLCCWFQNIFADPTNGIYLLLHCTAPCFPCFSPQCDSHMISHFTMTPTLPPLVCSLLLHKTHTHKLWIYRIQTDFFLIHKVSNWSETCQGRRMRS